MNSYYSVENEKYYQYAYRQGKAQEAVAPDYSKIAIPIGKKTESTNVDLTSTGNLPLVNNKKTSNTEVETQAKDKVKTNKEENDKTEKKPFEKTGESAQERFDRFFADKYSKANREEKMKLIQQYMVGYYETFSGKIPNEEITKIQITDFRKLMHNTQNSEDRELLAASLHYLRKENQVNAAEYTINDAQTPELRRAGNRGVAFSASKCHPNNQLQIAELVTKTKDAEATKIIATTSSEFDSKNQVGVVTLCQNAEISDDSKKEIDKILINQYSKYAKENQLDIHKIMSNSKFQETIEYAASNICKLDKENQVAAFKYTVSTGNEKAIISATAQYNNYDDSAKNEIKSTVYNSDCESAKSTLTREVISNIEEIAKNNTNPAILKDEIAKLTDGEIMTLLGGTSNKAIIKAILASHPSMAVLNSLGKVLDENNVSDREIAKTHFDFIGAEGQRKFMTVAAKNGDISQINRSSLNIGVRKDYDKMIEENKKA